MGPFGVALRGMDVREESADVADLVRPPPPPLGVDHRGTPELQLRVLELVHLHERRRVLDERGLDVALSAWRLHGTCLVDRGGTNAVAQQLAGHDASSAVAARR